MFLRRCIIPADKRGAFLNVAIGVTCIAALHVPVLTAQDYTDAIRPFTGVPGMGVRALGMGGAYTAVGGDYSSSFWNPATLSRMSASSVYASLSQHSQRSETGLLGYSSTQESAFTNLDGFGFAVKVPTEKGNLVWTIGRNSHYRFDSSRKTEALDPQLGADRMSVSLRERGGIHGWTAAFGVMVSPESHFGLALSWLRGSNEYIYDFDGYTSLDSIMQYSIDWSLKPNYNGMELKFGGFHEGENLDLGVTLTAPSFIKVEEKSVLSQVYDDTAYGGTSESGVWEYDLLMPYRFTVGAALRLGSALFAADIGYADWTQLKFSSEITTLDGMPYDDVVSAQIADSLRSTTNLRIGMEYFVPAIKAKIRLGVSNEPSPYRKILSGKDDRLRLTAGFGFLLESQIKLDFVLSHTSWENTLYDPAVGMALSEKVRSVRVIGSISYRY